VIYVDSSVALAHLLGETRVPPASLWDESLVSSRLLEYEMWNRVNARGLMRTHGDDVRSLLATVALLELTPLVLARAVEPFPVPVRTLDAFHLASIIFLKDRGEPIILTTYDERLARAASALGVSLLE
jgi:predicted nucleic acid-binding protein